MALWAVQLRQSSGGQWLNDFSLNVVADTKVEAKCRALEEMKRLSDGLQTIHVQDNPFANAQRRPYRHLGWPGARTIIVSVRRVKECEKS